MLTNTEDSLISAEQHSLVMRVTIEQNLQLDWNFKRNENCKQLHHMQTE